MLKKIVKYGNSSALVLDKAILELLNIREGSLVKLSTDGKSLIITPHETVPTEQVSPTVTQQTALLDAVMESLKKQAKETDPAVSTKELEQAAAVTKKCLERCNDEYETLRTNSEYKKELERLKKKFKDDRITLMKEVALLQQKYVPELQVICKELDTSPLMEKLKKPGTHECADMNKMDRPEVTELQKKYLAINEKYKSALAALEKIESNEDYQHDAALLAQKQQATPVDLKTYNAAMFELLCRYIPDWRAYQEEMLKAAQEFEEKNVGLGF